MKKLLLILIALFLWAGSSWAQLTGTKTIPGDYATISAAVTDLNTLGVGAGGVIFDVAAGYTESVTAQILITATGVTGNAIVFQKSGSGANPLITRTDAGTNTTSALGGLGDAIIRLDGTDYITFDGIDVTASTSTIEYGYLTSKPSGTNGCQNVTIKNSVVTMTKGTSAFVIGIYIGNGTTSVSSATGVVVSATSGINQDVTIIGNTVQNVHAGIYTRGSSAAGFYDNNITIGQSGAGNIIQNYGGGSATSTYGVYFIYVNNPNVAYNTINNVGGGGANHGATLYGVFYSTVLGNVVGNNNAITLGNSATSATNWLYSGSTVTTENFNNNVFAAGTFASTSASYLIYSSNSTPTKTTSGNSTSGTISKTSASGSFYCYYDNGSPTGTANVYGNTFNNITLAGTSAFYGISSTTAAGHTQNFYNNNINTITLATGTFYGFNLTVANTRSIYGNTIHTISSGGTIYGINLGSGSGTAGLIYKNKIYNLSSSPVGAVVYGIYNTSGTLVNIYNNFISDLKAPAATGANAVAGIFISGGTTVNLYYNTIYLNASGGATFGSSGIYKSSTTTSDFRNNIVVNNSTPGSTSGNTVALRWSGAYNATYYTSTSNNNLFYAGTPAANRLIYFDGTNSDQTIAAYKSRVAPRDASSFTENPPFVDVVTLPYDLHMQTGIATQCESGGTTVSTPAITDDYDAEVRNVSTPDVGADEFTGIGMDLSGPSISYTLLGNSIVDVNKSFTPVTITDASSVNTTTGTKPRVYYKKTGDTNDETGWKYVEANGSTSPFDFTIDYSLLTAGSVSAGDVIQYFVVAQDLATTPNIGINSGSFAATPASVALTSAAFPIGGTINSYNIVGTISGTKTVGTGGDYTSLTAVDGLFADLNAKVVSGNLTINIISDLTETGVTALNQITETGVGNYTLTIQPDAATLRTISGSYAGGLIRLNGADRVTIDGNFSSSGQYLTFNNTNAASAVIMLVSSGASAGASNNTIKNCNIIGGALTSSAYGIVIGGATVASTGADNDNNTIQGNTFTKAYVGLWAQGNSATNPGLMDNLSVTGNTFGSAIATDYLAHNGIMLAYTTGSNVTLNTIFNISMASSTVVGLSLGTGVVSTTITQNNINNVISTSTGGWGGRALYVNTGNSASNLTIANNVIHSIGGDGYTGFSASSPVGIFLDGVTGGVNIYYNSVYLSGNLTYTSATLTAAMLLNTSTITNIDLRNNVFQNSMNNGITAGSKNYAIYSGSANTAFTNINYNDYYVSGVQGVLGYLGADLATLGALQTAFGQNANSVSADPLFTSTTNLLPLSGTPLMAAGTPVSVTTDYNGTTRSVTTPTIGAYELAITAAIDWANLQWPGTANIVEGASVTVYAQAWEDGVTPGAGQGAGIQCWIGWNATDTNPNTWTNWTAATYNGDSGNNDEYKATIGGSLAAGTYYYASRFIITDGAYQYGGFSGGFWDGTTNVSGVLNVTNSDIGWANLATASASITQGGSATIYGQVWVDGVTSNSGSSDAISAWIGYGTSATDFSGYTWTTATFSSQVGNNDEYTASIGASLAPGTYYYVARYKFLTDAYVYGGYSAGGGGFWDGTTYLAGTLTVNPYTITIPYSQGFESVTFPPTAWTAQSVLGTEVWARSTAGFRTGVASAAITYQTTGGEDWLITPKVMTIVSGDQLAFYWKNKFGSPYPPDQLDVLVSTTDATLSSFTTTLGTINTGISTPSWVAINYSLDAFAGQNIYIAFKHTDTDGNGIYLDDVALTNVNTLWTGTSSTDWTVAGNWSNGVPTSGMNVTIADVTNNPLIATAVTVNNLTINSGGVLSISPAGQLTVTTALTNNGGTAGLILKSDGSGTGSLMHNSDNVNATIERYVTGSPVLTNNHYHNVAIPMNADMTAAVFTGMYAFNFDAVAQNWVSLGSSTSTPVYKDRGYMIYSPLSSTTISFAGQMNNSNFLTSTPSGASSFVDPDYIGGYNLVPNPYPSAIDWDVASGFTETNLRTSIWLFNASSGNYGAYVRGASGGTGTNGATRTIPVGQAFFVQASTAGAPALTITNAARKHGNANILKQTESMKDMLRMKSYNDLYSDELIVKFDGAASNAFDDAMDAQKLRGSAEASQIYSLTPQGTELSINNVPYSTQTVTIPVAFELGNSSEATFSFTGIESFESSVSIFLEDKLLNKTIDLRLNPVYNFTHTAAADPMRFNLVFYGVNSSNELSTANYNIWVNNDKINVLIPEMIGQKAVVQLIDQQGRILDATAVILDSPTAINAPVSSGLYIVRVIVGDQVFTSKVFIR